MKKYKLAGNMLMMVLFVLFGSYVLTMQTSAKTNEQVTITFNLTVESTLPSVAYPSIGCSVNDWNPTLEEWTAKQLDDHHYELVVSLDESLVGTTIAYKWTMQDPTIDDESGWTYIECDEDYKEGDNRYVVVSEGNTTVEDYVYQFATPVRTSTLSNGTLDTIQLDMPQFDERNAKTVYIWLPEGYDESDYKTKYPVLYMMDGETLFDELYSEYGEWGIDEAMARLVEEEDWGEAFEVAYPWLSTHSYGEFKWNGYNSILFGKDINSNLFDCMEKRGKNQGVRKN